MARSSGTGGVTLQLNDTFVPSKAGMKVNGPANIK